jgi:hypothetical protein
VPAQPSASIKSPTGITLEIKVIINEINVKCATKARGRVFINDRLQKRKMEIKKKCGVSNMLSRKHLHHLRGDSILIRTLIASGSPAKKAKFSQHGPIQTYIVCFEVTTALQSQCFPS